MVCGRCDNPYTMAALDDFEIKGDTMTFNILHEDWGPGSLPFHNQATVHVTMNEMRLTTQQCAIIALSVMAMSALHALLRYTRLGKEMRATAANPELARTSGIQTARVTSIAWLISGLFCGAAGVTAAINLTAFDTTTGSTLLLVIVAAAVFGGVGQPYGAMLGAFVIGMATELAALVSPSLKDVIAFAILALMLLVRPNGLIPAPSGAGVGVS